MEKVYISLGADCGGAGALREVGKKTYSFPFDWLVSFHSIYLPFQNEFKGFLEDRVTNTEIVSDANEFNLQYNIRFFHRELIKDYDATLQRRIDRLLAFLNAADKEMIFVRRSHSCGQHREMQYYGLSSPDEIDEVQDMMMLRDILILKYPKLKFKLNLFIQCPTCNKDQKNFESEYLTVRMSTQRHIPNQN